jgi:hypothetical protein
MSQGRARWVALAIVAILLLAYPTARLVRSTAMTRGGMSTFTRLIASANVEDLETVRALCTTRYLAEHPIHRATEGGVAGFPRTIHKNFQVWSEGNEVWLCPGNRVGAVYRLVKEGNLWKFDGLVGLLKPGGRVEILEQVAGSGS